MKFSFVVKLTDDDYYEFNKFHMLRSPYGKKTVKNFRISMSVVIIAIMIAMFVIGYDSLTTYIAAIPMMILLILTLVFAPKWLAYSLKAQIAQLKKHGKCPYSPDSVIEFHENALVEITDEQKTEQKYSSIERISIVDDRFIYLHIDTVRAYILPFSSISSAAEREELLAFLNTVCASVVTYNA